jgi:hypothetical protein
MPPQPGSHSQCVPVEITRQCGHGAVIYALNTSGEIRAFARAGAKIDCHECLIENVESHGYKVIRNG